MTTPGGAKDEFEEVGEELPAPTDPSGVAINTRGGLSPADLAAGLFGADARAMGIPA